MQIIKIAGPDNGYFHGEAQSTRGRRWKFGFTPNLKTVWIDRELNYAGRTFWLHMTTPPAALVRVVRHAVRKRRVA